MAATDFIEVYEDALDWNTCATIVQRFEKSGQATRGETGGGVDTKLKDSWDIKITGRPEWQDVERALNAAMLDGLEKYVRRHPYAVLAPFSLKMPDPSGDGLLMLDPAAVEAMTPDQLKPLLIKLFRPGSINLQKYVADVGGYPYWHCEQYPKADNGETLHRVLLWSIYLNEGFDEGETEFFYQQRRIKPQTGSLLIAPVAFTHTHRGNMPRKRDKYIATSWILFQRAEQLYAQPKT